jgi:hypothetical protein
MEWPLTLNFQGKEYINPGISREGGIQALDFQGEE